MINRIKKSVIFRLKRYFKHYDRKYKLRNTCASKLKLGEIDSLELLEICKNSGYKIKTIYDIGAHIGVWSVLAKSIFPNSKIECFEPVEHHIGQLKNTLKHIDNFSVHHTALGTKIGNTNIHITNSSDSSSIMNLTELQNKVFGVFEERLETVEINKLDDFVEKNNLLSPDLMKLDVQGYELEVLKSGIVCMNACKFIILEVSFLEFYKGQPLFEEVILFMASLQYKVLAFGHNTATGIKIEQCDILFERIN